MNEHGRAQIGRAGEPGRREPGDGAVLRAARAPAEAAAHARWLPHLRCRRGTPAPLIKQAQALGFSLKEIKALLALRLDPRASCADVRRRAEAKIADIDAKLHALRAMKRALVRLTAACAGRSPVSACPILESLEERAP